MIDEPDVTLPQLIQNILFNVNTSFIGQVTKYEDAPPRVTIQPVIMRQYGVDEEPVKLKPIEDVRLMHISTGNVIITAKPTIGSFVLCVCTQRSMDEWLASGDVGVPKSKRRFSDSDAVALGGIFSDDINIDTLDDGVSIRSHDGKLKIHVNENITLINDGTHAILEPGRMSVRGELEVNNTSLRVWNLLPTPGWIDLGTHGHAAFNAPPTPSGEPWK
jgi:hypothetical protein